MSDIAFTVNSLKLVSLYQAEYLPRSNGITRKVFKFALSYSCFAYAHS